MTEDVDQVLRWVAALDHEPLCQSLFSREDRLTCNCVVGVARRALGWSDPPHYQGERRIVSAFPPEPTR